MGVEHKIVTLTYPFCPYNEVELDSHIAGLISLVWSHGICTGECCEGGSVDNPLAYIAFPSRSDYKRFWEKVGLKPKHWLGLKTYEVAEKGMYQVKFPPSSIEVFFERLSPLGG